MIMNVLKKYLVSNLNKKDKVCKLILRRKISSKTYADVESNLIKKLKDMNSENICNGIKKSVKNGFINKNMFEIYNNMVKKHLNNFNFSDIVLILQSYALCKERNFEIYSILSNRSLYIFKENKIKYESLTYDNIYKYIIASNKLNFTDFELMVIFLKQVKKNLDYYGIKKISKILHALSKLKINDEELLEISSNYILQNFDQIKSNYINHLISAYTKSNNNYSELCLKLIKYIYENINSFDSISIYNILIQIKYIINKIKSDKNYSIYFSEENILNYDKIDDLNKYRTMNSTNEYIYSEKKNNTQNHDINNDININDNITTLNKEEYGIYKKELEEICFLNGDNKDENNVNYYKKILKSIIHLLFSKVNSCLAFLSLKQIIKLLCSYKDLNYFNYIFIYKRLLHFLFSKIQSNKINLEESILILEFFVILPYVDNNMEQIINIIIQNLEKNIIFNYSYIYRLLLCFKNLNIHNDNILSKIDCFIFKNKKNFEKNCNFEELNLFMYFYNKNAEEWGEMVKYLNFLKDKKGNTKENTNEENNQVDHTINKIDINKVDKKLIIYKYNKIEKCFNENEKSLNDDNDPKNNSEKNSSSINNKDISKSISNYLHFNLVNYKKSY
ncbi:conserved Plasmodium protein, unknown function [Plasmodium gallinaceum]|uniref:Uncharacterized protein n=1 Tax=Plasmodium gallinaceum TaxID=5849 RepID=A0A1J1GXB7_PLAGA|nr:conserved Plasmodium protein, unknown function [Plasmodium gallinaceum]CRG97201.1 conserved Plasmodium protein, unknown function [Plasmodium gallinaceum]